MSKTKKILLYFCMILFLFVLGMMVRRFYDSYVDNKPVVDTPGVQHFHRVVEPAKELPVARKKPAVDSSGQSAEKKD